MSWPCQAAVTFTVLALPCLVLYTGGGAERWDSARPTRPRGFAASLREEIASASAVGSGRRSLVIGLCGGISSGKSTVRESLRRLGAATVDADALGHHSYAQGTDGFSLVRDAFEALAAAEGLGPLVDTATGDIDRAVLGALVLDGAHPERLDTLNRILWPILGERVAREVLDRVAAGAPLVVVEAAVLLEAGWADLFDEVWAVDVDEATALQRLVARGERRGRPLSRAQARGWVERQRRGGDFGWRASDERVSVVLCNRGGPGDLRLQVAAACLRRALPLGSCLPPAPPEEAAAERWRPAPEHRGLLLAAPLLGEEDAPLMERLGRCVAGTKSQPARLVRLVTGDLGHVADLGGRLTRLYAAGVSGACSQGHMNTDVDVLLDYLQPRKSVTWLARLLASGLVPATEASCGIRSPPPQWRSPGRDRRAAVDAVAPRGLEAAAAPHTAAGGTFDHLHAGHKALLTMTLVLGLQKATIGVTSDAMVHRGGNKQCTRMVQHQVHRRQMVHEFLSLMAPGRTCSVVLIDDIWGPVATDASISLLVASTEFNQEALRVSANRMRGGAGLPPMQLQMVPLVEIPCATPAGTSKFGSSSIRLWLYGNRCAAGPAAPTTVLV